MFSPKDMLKIFVYGYFNGIRSSRKLAKQSIINKEIIWLIKGIQPKYRVIADFRKDKKAKNYFRAHVAIALISSGVVLQQPPISWAPLSNQFLALQL